MIKNWALVFFVSSILAGIGLAQDPAHGGHAPAPSASAGGEHKSEGSHDAAAAKHDEGDPYIMWKWINFGLLAVGLGFLASKNLPPFFASRTEEIQKGITESAKLKADADAKFADMEKRMAKLGAEIETLREQGKSEIAAEGARIRKETEGVLAKLQAGAEAEIESSAKAARQELKTYAAQLSVDLAEQRIRARGGAAESGLVDKFIRNLERKGANN